MKFKLVLALLAAGSLAAGAQSQGYQDGIEYYKAGQHDNAKTILTRTINESATNKALANYYLGQVNLAQGDRTAAKACFDAGVAADAMNPFNYVGLGALDLLNGNENGANDNFKKAQNLGKKNNEVIVAIARAYYNADPVKYDKELQKYLAKAHKDSKHQEPSIYILEGDMLLDKEDFGGAAGKYEMAIRYDENNPEGYVKYANSYFRVNPNFAISKLEDFLKVAPQSALAQRELAEKYYEGNHWKKAAELYGNYIKNPNHFPEDKQRYAVLLYWGGNYDQSLKVAEELLAQDPSNFPMQRFKFHDLAQLQRYDDAAKAAESFFKNNPNGYFITNDYTTYADVLTNLGQDSLAVVQYELAAEKDPKNGDLLQQLSAAYTKNKDFVKAADAYDRYVQTIDEPTANDLYGAAGRYLNVAVKAGDDDALRATTSTKGLEYINKAMSKAEPNPSLYQIKARLQLAANHNQPNADAIETYGEMVALLDQNPANMDPANPDNNLNLYKEAYQFTTLYYTKEGDNKELASQFNDKLKAINELLAQ